jgi:hypothetical protein
MRRLLCASLLLSLGAVSQAHAQFEAGVGIGYYDWSERTSPVEVKESGPLFTGTLGWTQRGANAVRFAYRGWGGVGVGNYRGSFQSAPSVPVEANTVFGATTQEGQLRWQVRSSLELISSLAFDFWHRQISASQQEDYQLFSVILGLESRDVALKGWSGGGGVRLPVWIREDAHFDQVGFSTNPTLEPGRQASVRGSLRYRFSPHLSCTGSLDTFQLGKSPAVTLEARRGTRTTAYQPATTLLMPGIGVEYRW